MNPCAILLVPVTKAEVNVSSYLEVGETTRLSIHPIQLFVALGVELDPSVTSLRLISTVVLVSTCVSIPLTYTRYL